MSGAVAATMVGTAVHAGMGFRGSIALVSYFASASALGRLPRARISLQQRGNRRDAVQVLANGGPPALFALLHARSAASSIDLAEAAFYGSLAAAAADTWATEVGTRYGGSPRNIITTRKAAPGESGAVTFAGLFASLAASSAIAAAAHVGASSRPSRALSCVAGGIAGSLTDSLLGALVQEQRWCESCSVRTELPVHTCGAQTRHVAGLRAVNNDVVNLLSVLAGGLIASAASWAMPDLAGRIGSRVEFATTSTNSRVPRTIGAA
jgi:uncharacterized protein (TIGR00297 family)